jgi:hypothetical protein
MRGCRTLVFFKGAGFDFALAGSLPCSTNCGAITGEATCTSLLLVVIVAVPFLEAHAHVTADDVRSHYKFLLLGYVIMPEHVHLLVSEPAKGDPSKVLQVLKQKVSRALRDGRRESRPGQLARDFAPSENGCAGILATPLLRF